MAKLLKIIMINGHLPGVVELDLDGHTNICGSNASGKTTLQRMIPVFYGELPNRVVPKTRLNFDKYYLPYKNSYVIYEYQRPANGPAQVVLTKRADGIDYRFIDCGYQAEDYLYEKKDGVVAREYSDWAQDMRGRGIDITAKISSTTEYRNIILNDIKNDRSSRSESIKHRQLAARYGLANDNFRLRHIEKLVSAVHAKEGKMDTLKSMLAAILEEDGYKRPDNTFTGDKIRAWLRDMKQFLKVDRLQKSLADIERISADRTRTLEQLWHLKAVIENDFSEQKRLKADTEAATQTLKREINDAQNAYEALRSELRDRKSDAQADVKRLEEQLNDAQQQYDNYRDNDIERLGRELEALPERRSELQGLEQHYATMMDAHKDEAQKLQSHKLEIKEELEQRSTKLRRKIEDKAAQKTAVMQQELDAAKQLNQLLQQQQQAVREQYEAQLEQQQNELAAKRAQRELSTLTDDERNEMQIAEARVDQAQEKLNQHQQVVSQQQEQLNVALRERERLDSQVTEARTLLAQSEQRIEQLQQRLQPAAGSLRQFLTQNVEHWEQSFGRVVPEPLLQRTDLTPRLIADDQSHSLFGVELDLHAIDLPEHAVSEERLREQLEIATEHWQQQQQQLKNAEKAFADAVEQAKQQQQTLDAAKQQQRQLSSDVDYARDNKARLAHAQQKLEQERKQQVRERITQLERELEHTKAQRSEALEELQDDHNARVMEVTAEFQERTQLLQEAIDDLNAELARKQDAAKQRIKELEQAFSEKLADQGVDENKMREIKQQISQLQQQIRDTDSRRDEYSEYQTFMRVTWDKQRAQWLDQEQQAKAGLRKASSELEQHESQFKTQQQQIKSRLQALKDTLEKTEKVVLDLQSLVQRMADLPAALNPPQESAAAQGDVSEHCARSYKLLDEKQKQDKDLEQRIPRLEAELREDADLQFLRFIEQSLAQQGEAPDLQVQVNTLSELLKVLEGKRDQTIDQGKTIGKGLFEFFTVFNDIHKRVSDYSRRLTQAVTDELTLDGIDKAEVKISSTIDELSFWQPLKQMTQHYRQWIESGALTPPAEYIDHLTDVAELLKANQEYSIESLIKLQLNLVENGEPVVIRNDRQLTDSSSHGMAYLILCKFLLAFTRLLRPEQAGVTIHWPIDEIGTLAYHNVEKLFVACDNNNIDIVGAFPNPESDVLLLFKHRYLIEPHKEFANKGQLKRIKPRVSELSQKLQALQQDSKEANA
tara:strand:+ start:36733 stop:40416 length:3684 start_codon:yes stop_codon:yes gene_type:complete